MFALAVAGGSLAVRDEAASGGPCMADAATSLGTGSVLERQIATGDRHAYRVELETGQFARAEVDQRAVDLVVELVGHGQEVLAAIDNPYETRRPEIVPLLGVDEGDAPTRGAPARGAGCFVVRPFGPVAPGASYRVTLAAGPRPVTEGDRALFLGLVELERGQGAAGTGFLAEAVERLTVAADRLGAAGNPLLEAEARQSLGDATLGLRDDPEGNQRAQWELEAALAMYRALETREPRTEAGLLNQLGRVQQRLSSTRAARVSHEEALALAVSTALPDAERFARSNLSVVLARLGDFQAALDQNRTWLAQAREQRLVNEELSALVALANLWLSLGNQAEARGVSEDLLARARAGGDTRAQARALGYLGSLARRRGEWNEVSGFYDQALALVTALPAGTVESDRAAVLGGLGNALSNQGRHEPALARVGEAAQIYARLGWHLELALLRFNEGAILAAAGRPAAGLVRCGEALAELEKLGHESGQASALMCQARALADLERLGEAVAVAERSIAVVETLWDGLEDPELRLLYRESKREYYASYIDFLMQQGAPSVEGRWVARALEASERTHARLLLEDLWALRDGLRQRIDPVLSDQAASLWAQLDAAAASAPRPGAQGQRDLALGVALKAEYERVEEEIRRQSAAYAALTRPRLLPAKEIQRRLLDDDTELLVYSLGRERSYLWHLGPRFIRSHTLAAGALLTSLAERAATLLARSEDPTLAEQTEVALRELSREILGPLAGDLQARRLIVVPEGALQYIPFAALPHPDELDRVGGQPTLLIDRQEVVTLPSASVLAVLREMRSRRPRPSLLLATVGEPVLRAEDSRLPPESPGTSRMATFADGGDRPVVPTVADSAELEELPYARIELAALRSKVAPGLAVELSGLAAHRDRLAEGALRGVRIIHFATHAAVDASDPGASRIVLSRFDHEGRPRDGSLSLLDVYSLELEADLVVLSACRTALGPDIAGEGLISFTRGFMYAGVPSVVVSLWNVDDEATAVLMERFYTLLLEKGLAPGAALREAQLSVRREPRWRRPFHWAAFSLHGDWR